MSRRLLWLNRSLRWTVKPVLRRMGQPARVRWALDFGTELLFRPPPQTQRWPETIAGIPCLWVTNRAQTHPPEPERVLLYLHGGGYIAGSPKAYTHLLARLARLTRMQVCAPNYRKAPEAPSPAAFEDAVAAFDGLVAKGYAPENITIGGDSAGGGLALALLAHINAQGIVPASVFAFSPFTDASFSGGSMHENATRDPLLPPARKDQVADWILAGMSPQDPRISPLFASFRSPLPPVFLQVSDTEILRDDTVRMAEKLRAAGGRVTVDLWPDPPHVWVFFSRLLPEAKEALRRVAAFISAQEGAVQADQEVEAIDNR
ncbi:alpha/beta hydrolase [Aliiroseovarius crassostreae]|uniref:alpha/beta hydrolase fold domain-containing protein n=1 Tax=Aliiroseovarius crassostreae TaxID=154981 RepID=UPI0022087BF9|nr:alpha/beta hydrolase [Aliiroseovarius crassostreae]UWQ11539.1 alpha/beta hydrolase [Aliiroseovarius crassostreae]